MSVAAVLEKDYFTDYSILLDPYEYFDAMRAIGPVCEMPATGALLVTGFKEAVEVLRNNVDFSSINSTVGAGVPLPFEPNGSDISEQLEQHRDFYVGGDLVVTFDDGRHRALRSIANKLFTPSRLKQNQEYIHQLAKTMVQQAVMQGGCDLVNDIATPFVTLVIADLLGVPAEDREKFREVIDNAPPPGNLDQSDAPTENSPLVFMGTYFFQYLMDRKSSPKADVLTELAQATYPDGSEADLLDMVKLATFMFGAGQDTSAKLLSNAMKYIVDIPGLQAQLRADPKLIGNFLEEVLRLEGSTKATTRVARKDTQIGERKVSAGTRVLVALAAANRDPMRWPKPNTFILNRPKIAEHVAFGRGVHTCVGAPLARTEVRIILEHFLAATREIGLCESNHGSANARKFNYEASFIIRGLSELFITLAAN
ncbi:cytochrome P450 [Halioxenophilus sp. WMMB6]|uniref:cytochrome P450 n=1 Tax=Halioxenophilus sp. WMMB6 TaxID=3073815 RepID=UPI00295F592A|nr:cytochrome P450 [Halioxenophilus sp. WMMB6]